MNRGLTTANTADPVPRRLVRHRQSSTLIFEFIVAPSGLKKDRYGWVDLYLLAMPKNDEVSPRLKLMYKRPERQRRVKDPQGLC